METEFLWNYCQQVFDYEGLFLTKISFATAYNKQRVYRCGIESRRSEAI